MKGKILFVGSVPLEDTRHVLSLLATKAGAAAARLPDGETGTRTNWIRWQDRAFAENPDFVLVEAGSGLPGAQDALRRPFFDLRDGVDPGQVSFGELGYAREGLRSYEVFRAMQEAGEIPAATRFQVSIPTALNILTGFVLLRTRALVEPALEAALRREVASLAASVPPEKLAIQWDVCLEVTGHDGSQELHVKDVLADSVERIARHIGFVPAGAEVGVHLCYGDPGHKHLIEPTDLLTCVKFANAICAASPRPVAWIHMPVPRERDDDDYFRPLTGLSLPGGTDLFLGVVHLTDGIEGTARRIATAKRYAGEFGIATECGFGRRDPATVPALLDVHVAAARLI